MIMSDSPETMRGKCVGPNRDLGLKYGCNQQPYGQMGNKEN